MIKDGVLISQTVFPNKSKEEEKKQNKRKCCEGGWVDHSWNVEIQLNYRTESTQ